MAEPKNRGFSKDPRIRARQQKSLEVYAEQAPFIGGDPEKDRQAKIVAVERAGYTKAQTEAAKVKQFMRLWKSDEARAYLCELWGLAMEPEVDQDPVSLAMRLLHTHATQTDDSWGPRDRGVSLAATREMIRLFIPAQTTKIASVHMSTRIDRPAAYDEEPVMEARSILPAGTKIAKPTGPTGGDDEGDEDDD